MDEALNFILNLFVLALIYAFIFASPRKRRKRRRERERARGAWTAAPKAAQVAPVVPVEQAASAASAAQMRVELENAGEGEDPCHDHGGTLHPVQPAVRPGLAFSGEGEGSDPCHPAREQGPESAVYDSPILSHEPERGELASRVLAGVVMSEVLTRPAERRALARLRRRV